MTRSFIARTILLPPRREIYRAVHSRSAPRAVRGSRNLGPLLTRRGHTVRYHEVPVASLADIDPLEPDLLVVLGGPIGVYETDLYPFLVPEIELIARRLRAARPTLGLCLGSQLMAKALGARVYSSGIKEIGWTTLELTADGRASCLRHVADTPVLHWHGDTFDLPDDAVRLASTPACKNQAFSWGNAALALQFHVEAAGVALESWFVGHAAEIAATQRNQRPAAARRDGSLQPGNRRIGDCLFG